MPQKEDVMRDAANNPQALPEQGDWIDPATTLIGKSRSDFTLEAACNAAQAVALDQVFFSLDAGKFHQFTAMLEAPPSHNPGFERLMAVTPVWTVIKA
jgi:uncharacterized protein (DUF1778 family)